MTDRTFDLTCCEASPEWLEKLNSHRDHVLSAMELWDYDGGAILQAEGGISDPSLDDILGYFQQLTDLIAGWGDIFLTSGFNAAPLIKFRDMAYAARNPGTGWEMRVCEELTEECSVGLL